MSPNKKRAIPRPVHFETTVPVIRLCRCGVWLAAGVAEGQKARVELVQLDLSQQIWCILNHIEMFTITRGGLVRLDPSRMTDKRFQSKFPHHKCHVKWPPAPRVVPQPPGPQTIPF